MNKLKKKKTKILTWKQQANKMKELKKNINQLNQFLNLILILKFIYFIS